MYSYSLLKKTTMVDQSAVHDDYKTDISIGTDAQ